MNTFSVKIPKSLAQMGDLMLVSKKEYESFLDFKRIKEFTPTPEERKALRKSRLNRKNGNYLTLNEFKNKLGLTN